MSLPTIASIIYVHRYHLTCQCPVIRLMFDTDSALASFAKLWRVDQLMRNMLQHALPCMAMLEALRSRNTRLGLIWAQKIV